MSGPYDLAIKLSCVDAFSPAIAIIGKKLLGLEGTLKDIEKAKKAVFGGLAVFGGVEALKGMWDLAQQEQLGRAGMAHLDVLRLTADAYRDIAKAVPTAQASEVLRTAREMRAILGPSASLGQLEGQTAKALQVDALLANTFGKDHQAGEYYKLLRSAEMKGIATDAKKREEFTDAAFGYITSFGGKL